MSMTRQIPNPPNDPILLATLINRQSIRLTVVTANTGVRLAHDRGTLDSPPPFIGSSGLLVTDADRQIQEEWQGELWALGHPGNLIQATLEVDIGTYAVNP